MRKIYPYPSLKMLTDMGHTVESFSNLHRKIDAKIAALPPRVMHLTYGDARRPCDCRTMICELWSNPCYCPEGPGEDCSCPPVELIVNLPPT